MILLQDHISWLNHDFIQPALGRDIEVEVELLAARRCSAGRSENLGDALPMGNANIPGAFGTACGRGDRCHAAAVNITPKGNRPATRPVISAIARS